MAYRVQIRRGTAAQWQQANPVLLDGEFAIEKDTRKFKIGDGTTAWNDLPYATQGETGKNLEFIWNGTQLGARQEGQSVYQYVDLKGAKGDKGDIGATGKSIEFIWSGTSLGVRQEGQNTYQYVNLKGDKGDKGDVYFPTFSVDEGMNLIMHDDFNYDGTISFKLENGCLIQEVI